MGSSGIAKYESIRRDMLRLLGDTSAAVVTTMIDYYGLPRDFPDYRARPRGTCYERANFLEEAFLRDINHRRFISFLTLHEFEALLFVDPQAIAARFPGQRNAGQHLERILSIYGSPEEIDEAAKKTASYRPPGQ